MNKEVISDKQGISLIVSFIIGTNLIISAGLSAKMDLWLAIIIAIIVALPMILIYARLHYIFPDKNLFDIIEVCFGKLIGKVIIIIITWYIFLNSAEISRIFGQFVATVSLTNTNQIIIEIFMIILCIWVVKEGIEVLGRWSEFFFIFTVLVILFYIAFLLPNINISNITPTFYNGYKPIVKGTFESFIWPFSQIMLLSMVFTNFSKKESPYKVYIVGLLIGGIIVFLTSLITILVLGVDQTLSLYYPSYMAASKIDVGNFIQRLEIISGAVFSLGIFIKISVYLMASCKGIAKIFNCNDYRFIILPISLLIINVSYFEFESAMEFFEWNEIWYYYMIPLHIIIPIITWITAEIKRKYNNVKN